MPSRAFAAHEQAPQLQGAPKQPAEPPPTPAQPLSPQPLHEACSSPTPPPQTPQHTHHATERDAQTPDRRASGEPKADPRLLHRQPGPAASYTHHPGAGGNPPLRRRGAPPPQTPQQGGDGLKPIWTKALNTTQGGWPMLRSLETQMHVYGLRSCWRVEDRRCRDESGGTYTYVYRENTERRQVRQTLQGLSDEHLLTHLLGY